LILLEQIIYSYFVSVIVSNCGASHVYGLWPVYWW